MPSALEAPAGPVGAPDAPPGGEAAHAWRVAVARAIIGAVHLPWRIGERLTGRALPRADHYWSMRIFRALAREYPVRVRYPNPLAADGRRLTLHLDLCENNQQWHFRLRERFELDWLRWLAPGLAVARRFVDVGANIGLYALTIAQAHPELEVVAVEPLPGNVRLLHRNLAANRLERIRVHAAAVTDAPGATVTFHVNPIHDGGGSLVPGADYVTGDVRLDAAAYRRAHPAFRPVLEVPALRLDDLLVPGSVLKVDVEGAEAAVLRSGRHALSRGWVDVAVVEVREDTAEPVVELLRALGFDCYARGSRGPLDGARIPRRLGNLWCLRRAAALRVPISLLN